MPSQSNAPFTVEHRTDEALRALLVVAFEKNKATHWKYHDKEGLVFLWHGDDSAVVFPSAIGPEEAAVFTRAWLDSEPYPPQPDHDGDNEKGFRLYRDYWGNAGGSRYAIIAVAPCWAMFGK